MFKCSGKEVFNILVLLQKDKNCHWQNNLDWALVVSGRILTFERNLHTPKQNLHTPKHNQQFTALQLITSAYV